MVKINEASILVKMCVTHLINLEGGGGGGPSAPLAPLPDSGPVCYVHTISGRT